MSSIKTETERVMVIPTTLFHDCGYFQGFNPEPEKYLPILLSPKNTRYLSRDDMEQDPSFKQLIPYCIFRYKDPTNTTSIFQYTRGKGQGEQRLHAKKSIGIGGHISTLDLSDDSTYEAGMNRELEEELKIETRYEQTCVGLINDDDNDVGKVHLGIVHVFDVREQKVYANEPEIVDSSFRPVNDLIDDIEQFETWSQICIRALFQ